jgi:hypothetical protein
MLNSRSSRGSSTLTTTLTPRRRGKAMCLYPIVISDDSDRSARALYLLAFHINESCSPNTNCVNPSFV